MKPRIPRPLTAHVSTALAVAFTVVQINSSIASAATLTWDASGTNSTAPTDGAGIWNAANWSNGTTDVTWTNGSDIAVFGSNNGTAGTVSLSTGITVGGITFNSATSQNYTIAGGGNALTFDGSTAIALITTIANATISAPLGVTGSVTTIRKTGSGILELSGGGTASRIESGPSTGSLFLTGGTFTVGAMNFYDTGRGNDNTTNGNIFQTGGTVTTSANWDGRYKTSSYNITGGTLTATMPNRIQGIGTFNASGNAVATFTTNDPRIATEGFSGTLSINGNASFTHLSDYAPFDLVNSNNAVTGTINLGGGTLTVLGIHNGSTGMGTGIVNFNGGTLKAGTGASSNFFGAKALTTANVYGGGAIVDSNGKNISISQPLLGTTGNGINAITVTASGSGYTTAPSVTLSGGGGTGATGYALIDTNGTVTSIVITNPGKDYTSAPTIIFGSGSATATATAALVNANGGFTKNGAGTLTLSGANTYTGATTVNTGTLQAGVVSVAGVSGAFGNNSAVILANTSGVGLNLGGFTTQIGSLTGGGAAGGNVTANAALTVGGDNTSPAAYAGVISSTGSLIKIGTGTQILTGANTYNGTTSVNAGKLIVGVAGFGSITSNVTVASGATVGGSGTITGNLTLSAESSAGAKDGGKLAAGNSPGVLTVTGTTNFNTGSIFSWEIDTDAATLGRGTEYDGLNTTSVSGSGVVFQIVTSDVQGFGDNFWTTDHTWTDIFKSVNGNTSLTTNWSSIFSSFAYSNGAISLATPTGGSFTWTNSGNTLTWSAVPEPSSALGGILLGAGLLRRKRSQAAARR